MKARMLCALLTLTVGTGALLSPQADAALLTTGTLLSLPEAAPAPDVRDALSVRLERAGLPPDRVRARIDALTDAEVSRLAMCLDELPAGGDAVGAVIFIFLILLVTDILGYTDVYPFITRTVNGSKHASECVEPAPPAAVHTTAEP